MHKTYPIAGALVIVLSFLGGLYVFHALARAVSLGISPGKLGAIHHAGSAQYWVFVAACCIGIALMILLAFIGLRWTGLLSGARR